LLQSGLLMHQSFRKAIALVSTNVECGRELGFLWLAVNKQRKRKQSFQKLLELAPDACSVGPLGLMRLGKNESMAQ